ncbi:MAG: hypothetical protein JO372_12040 [Solirubrobacterales bacterium]|nr:hypothetical protein [Solirubrobacterales bacterium]
MAVICASASASPRLLALAARIARADPGRFVGGNTIVGTGDGGSLFGVPDRANFIFALGANETIFGGRDWNELGAVGNGVTIHAGRGNSYVWGGPGGTLVGGGGKDALIDLYANATVRLQSTGDEVVLSGRDDRVLCSPNARGDVIYVAPSDTVSSRCRADHDRVLRYHRFGSSTRSPAAPASPARTAASPVIRGDGSNEHPFQPDTCEPSQLMVCTITAFDLVPMNSFGTGNYWTGYVPAYKCPAYYPYLVDQDFTPPGSRLPKGVEVQEDWGNPLPIAFNITGVSVQPSLLDASLTTGIKTGDSESSATNWNAKRHWYRIILHCTSLPCIGVDVTTDKRPDVPYCRQGIPSKRQRRARAV